MSLAEQLPDVIVLDVHMPDREGPEMCRYTLRGRDQRLAKVPIVAISADLRETVVASMRAAGANEFLAKPMDFEALEEALRRLINP